MRRAPPFTGRASLGGVRSSPRLSARVSAKIACGTVQKRARAAAVIRRGTHRCSPPRGRPCRLSFVGGDSAFATDGSVKSVGRRVLGQLQFCLSTRKTIESFNVLAGPTLRSVREVWRRDLHSGENIGEPQPGRRHHRGFERRGFHSEGRELDIDLPSATLCPRELGCRLE
jgi:hypothetical protein